MYKLIIIHLKYSKISPKDRVHRWEGLTSEFFFFGTKTCLAKTREETSEL